MGISYPVQVQRLRVRAFLGWVNDGPEDVALALFTFPSEKSTKPTGRQLQPIQSA